jgi:pimeloyl-ACP methyl ester carboxylesterase
MAYTKRRLFCLPGLGADSRMFRYLDLPSEELVGIDWVVPQRQESLAAYTERLLAPYRPGPEDVMLGVSFGGIVALEAARLMGGAPLVVVSSIKRSAERPPYFPFFRRVPIQRVLPSKTIKRIGTIVPPPQRTGLRADEYVLFLDMVNQTDPTFMRWGIEQMLRWENQWLPPCWLHLHGDRDLLFPINRIPDATVIRGGTHFMIVRQASLINQHIRQFLQTDVSARKAPA